MRKRVEIALLVLSIGGGAAFIRCGDQYKDDYRDNSPTSGKLRVFYDEGLHLHVKNQAYTFESLYERSRLELYRTTETEAIRSLFIDSCESIVVSRLLNGQEKTLFASREFTPRYSAVAVSGIAFVTAASNGIYSVSPAEIRAMLSGTGTVNDTAGRPLPIQVVVDRNNSSVSHYLADSILAGGDLSKNCFAAKNTIDCLEYVAAHGGVIGVIDFAWISDRDDSLYKAFAPRLRILGVETGGEVVHPSQSSFKLGMYPYARTIYVMRKTGDFSLAKGFESFVAGQKGQLTFLKQGLLPTRQPERLIEVKFEPLPTE